MVAITTIPSKFESGLQPEYSATSDLGAALGLVGIAVAIKIYQLIPLYGSKIINALLNRRSCGNELI